MQFKILLSTQGRPSALSPFSPSNLRKVLHFSSETLSSRWVQNNQLFQRHPRLQLLQHHCCTTFHHLKQLLSYVFVSGLHRNPFVMSRLLYLSLIESEPGNNSDGTVEKSEFGLQIFNQIAEPNIFSWNTMIRYFAASRNLTIALHYYIEMLRKEMAPDKYTFPFLLQACGSCPDSVKLVHSHVLRLGFGQDLFVQNSILHAYAISGCLTNAWLLFDKMPDKDIVSWTSLISGLVSQSDYISALCVFKKLVMVDSRPIRPNAATIVSIISACGNLGSLDLTRCVHGFINKSGLLEQDVSIANSLIDAYAKCGNCDSARKTFDEIEDLKRDLYSWTAIISGYAMHEQGANALHLFSQMGEGYGLKPDGVTFVVILSACAHSGLVEEALFIFEAMNTRYGIDPDLRHYGCVVDLLGRAGMLEHAYNIIENMKMEPNLAILGSLLNGCQLHCNMEIGEAVSRRIERMKKRGGATVLLSNMYANKNRWTEVVRVRKEMRGSVKDKPPGRSWIQVKDVVNEFVAGNKVDVQGTELCVVLESLEKLSKV